MKDDDFKLFGGFADGQMDKRINICDCRVALATENIYIYQKGQQQVQTLSAEERNDLLPSKFWFNTNSKILPSNLAKLFCVVIVKSYIILTIFIVNHKIIIRIITLSVKRSISLYPVTK